MTATTDPSAGPGLRSQASGELSLAARFHNETGPIYLTGVQSLVRVLLEQRRADMRRGLNTAGLVSGYPGSPLGGVDIELERQRALLDEYHIVHIPGLNEDLAATALWGSQTVRSLPGATVDGVFGMWFAKAPGVDRSGDAFRTANIRGVDANGGVLCVAGDDPDARSTNYPTDSNGAFYDWSMPILFPGDVQEILDLGLHGYALSRCSGLWTGFKMVTDIADGAGSALAGIDRVKPLLPSIEMDGAPFSPRLRVNEVGGALKAAERDLRYGRLKLAEAYIRLNALNPITVEPPSPRLGVVAAGKTYHDLRKAFDTLGLGDDDLRAAGVRVKKVNALFPIEAAEWRDFAAGLEEVIVVEEKRPFLERFVKEALYGTARAPLVVGKADERGQELFAEHGELTADLIAGRLGSRLRDRWGLATAPPPTAAHRPRIPLSVNRTPYFCSGCPHNRSLVVPDGSIVGVGIGCHIMELIVPREEYGQLNGFTQMGAEGAQWIGASRFTTTEHIFQNIGDGTFHHSGSLALRAAVAAGVNITYKLLYNGAVGMTGGQDVAGVLAVPELTQLLAAEGVVRTIVTTDDRRKYRGVRLAAGVEVWHRDRLVEAQEALAATPGVTVLLHDQYCAAEKRRLRKRAALPEPTLRVAINERVCEGCGDCGRKSQCLSVQPVDTPFGRKTAIHQSSCNLDYSCLLGDCPSFLTIDTKPARRSTPKFTSPPTDLPAPTPPSTDAFNVLMLGIGGTGVVTTSQVLATAATIDGWAVRVLDHTGSSQKAGPVVSQLQVHRSDQEPPAAIGRGETDLVLAFDLLSAVGEANTAKMSADRTVVVGSTSRVPTGEMATRPDLPYPAADDLCQELTHHTRASKNVYLDAQAIAVAVFGNYMFANTIVVGAAIQSGLLGLELESVREAIRLNGTAVDANLAALDWGRAVASRPELVERAVRARDIPAPTVSAALAAAIDEINPSATLRPVVELRVAELTAYQNERHARRYLDVVAAVAARERELVGSDGALSETVAKTLHQLMAYKDEYEVARLLLDAAADARLRAEFGQRAKVSWNLHPPILRAMGWRRKVRLGPWFTPVLRSLASAKWLRGTRCDPFGAAHVRRVERELVEHYLALVEVIGNRVTAESLGAWAEIAGLPEMVRGYEDVKLGNVRRYLAAVRDAAEEHEIEVHLGPRLRRLVADGDDSG